MHHNDIVTLSLWDRMRIQLLEAGEALVLAVVPRGPRRRRLLTRIERELTLGHGNRTNSPVWYPARITRLF
jgi:hypothetical protein